MDRKTHALTVYGGGSDIWEQQDQFRYVYREVRGDFSLTVRIDELKDTHAFAKAGLMLRTGLDPDSAHVLINTFPSGQLEFGFRKASGGLMQARHAGDGALPGQRLMIARSGNEITAHAAVGDQPFGEPCGRVDLPDLGEEILVGFAVLSHDNDQLTTATFRDWRIAPAAESAKP